MSWERLGQKERWRMLALLGVGCLGAALTGLAVGVLTADTEPWVRSALTIAAIALVAGLVTFLVVWRLAGLTARRFGLSAARYTRLGREMRRGRPPTDPGMRPAAVDIVARWRRTLESQGRRRYRWTRVALLSLWLVMAVTHLADGSYLPATLMLLGVLALLALPLSLRRQWRRLDAAERALGLPDQSPP
ncbi:hypothetical protein NGM36_06000 [Streptomyces mutabilis]|uniref:hypothetical protein n=1 Tax=Streptomyces mutabilis TaxID=67332 RepID=UPI0022BA1452|nr:hypothetical protein [Streptomyces mutabilis]MCZ9349348.1 hypothetical protein [Streptomyces mutabilis]